jgi:CDP-6-deoxy-D-xylo-4-hexulose-3-dehydrase
VRSERRIDYAGSVHDEREIEAVVEVLRGGPTALRIGRNVKAMEARVAELFGKRRGVMCNSGSSALYLAVEVLGLEPGDEIVTSAVTFSTDIAPMIRAGLVPAFVDVTPDTFQIDVDAIEEMIGPRTKRPCRRGSSPSIRPSRSACRSRPSPSCRAASCTPSPTPCTRRRPTR